MAIIIGISACVPGQIADILHPEKHPDGKWRNQRGKYTGQDDGKAAHYAVNGAHFHYLGRAGRMRRIANGQGPPPPPHGGKEP